MYLKKELLISIWFFEIKGVYKDFCQKFEVILNEFFFELEEYNFKFLVEVWFFVF